MHNASHRPVVIIMPRRSLKIPCRMLGLLSRDLAVRRALDFSIWRNYRFTGPLRQAD
jgi:hypothetical protein